MISVHNLSVNHGHLKIIKEISFSVGKGEIVSIVGANGAGKSTLLGGIAGIYSPAAGSIQMEDEELAKKSPVDIVRKGVTLVPERRQIFDGLTVEDNLILGSYHRYSKEKKQCLQDLEMVYAYFPKLAAMKSRLGGLLSGGEQQMLAIGRGLMAKPKLLMLDEPSLGLAPLIVREIMNILVQLRNITSTSILLVEQNIKAALSISDRGFVLERGSIVLEGEAKSLLQNQSIKDAYLGASPSLQE
ncbi:ABC transporter ATP-binding protein [Fictibacillus barbaricus]|uniref:ABC transporter ATP-binding protein n=1 Tax=Fictibacillus barbaricus TaxID=182136 RepID=A0ABS2ZCA3_9BACL|nr:ABC transporter ATP-binding protein [Fictibacillus barbaricus]MBN3545386.1 ABC transporter ATP-binding protein [Fictibacillus barbaricus]GGB59430.1 ABC transporter ATP-binding protein [Fictibacillus barbaricus]